MNCQSVSFHKREEQTNIVEARGSLKLALGSDELELLPNAQIQQDIFASSRHRQRLELSPNPLDPITAPPLVNPMPPSKCTASRATFSVRYPHEL